MPPWVKPATTYSSFRAAISAGIPASIASLVASATFVMNSSLMAVVCPLVKLALLPAASNVLSIYFTFVSLCRCGQDYPSSPLVGRGWKGTPLFGNVDYLHVRSGQLCDTDGLVDDSFADFVGSDGSCSELLRCRLGLEVLCWANCTHRGRHVSMNQVFLHSRSLNTFHLEFPSFTLSCCNA